MLKDIRYVVLVLVVLAGVTASAQMQAPVTVEPIAVDAEMCLPEPNPAQVMSDEEDGKTPVCSPTSVELPAVPPQPEPMLGSCTACKSACQKNCYWKALQCQAGCVGGTDACFERCETLLDACADNCEFKCCMWISEGNSLPRVR